MTAAADMGRTVRPPLVTVRPAVIGELAAVRAVATGVSPGAVYVVRFRVRAAPAAGSGCDGAAGMRVRSGSGPRLRIALASRRGWCPGTGLLSLARLRRGAAAGSGRIRIRPARALGGGDIVGRLSLGPTCPVERASDPCDPVARPAPVLLVAIDESGREAARTVTLRDGSFALDLAPGNYRLRSASTGTALPRIAETAVTVTGRATRSHPQRVVVKGDTGIR
jgi:hypothetical protein